jgi:hypothetical protein
MKYFIKDKEIYLGKPFTYNGLQYPGNWLLLASSSEKTSLGLRIEEDTLVDPICIPEKVDMRQFRLALLDLGILEEFEKELRGEVASIEWNFSTVVLRNNSFFCMYMKEFLRYSEEKIDNIFILAGSK